MSSLESGMYGFSVINPNGETSQTAQCTLFGQTGSSLPYNIVWLSQVSDDYKLAIPNNRAAVPGWAAIRTSVSGLWELEYSIYLTGGAGAGVADVRVFVEKSCVFDSNGDYSVNNSTVSYTVVDEQSITTSGTSTAVVSRKRVFLEKDCFVSIYVSTASGTAPTVSASQNQTYFSMRLISAENSGKASFQT